MPVFFYVTERPAYRIKARLKEHHLICYFSFLFSRATCSHLKIANK